MQTTAQDIRAGWRCFRSWKQRFWLSTRRGRGLEPRESRDILYLCNHDRVRQIEFFDGRELEHDRGDARDQKIAFMQAYLSIMALESREFERQVRSLLNLQSRLRAPSVLGFWFWQSDFAKFGAGVSPFFQGDAVSIFCERPGQIDFSDVFAIMPFDQILVRNQVAWKQRSAQKLVDHIERDLMFDGIKVRPKFSFTAGLLQLTLGSTDRGQKMNANRLRTVGAADCYREHIRK